ncbi:hypothetical protein [Staphylococcus americanisciuri]|uniref:Uncharacterized protein n=1 Tax=Staphylococcus americanisciuri TaxID=2973940 RepID=A0ABT2F0D0_9STAP|nr:hypothetical protein [Staphylococcus americanisciuri]MCS4485899.1 hypothetical protein [Staphylococcus americanisciuri]
MVNDLIQEDIIVHAIKVIIGPLCVFVIGKMFEKLVSSDLDYTSNIITISIIIITIYCFIAYFYYFSIKESIISKDDYIQILGFCSAGLVVMVLAIMIMSRIIIFKYAINRFYMYKWEDEEHYNIVFKGYNNLIKEALTVSSLGYWNDSLKKEKVRNRVIRRDYSQMNYRFYKDRYLSVIVMERKYIVKAWFKINGLKFSIFSVLSPVLFVAYLVVYKNSDNLYFILIMLIVINSYSLIVQALKLARFNKKNLEEKKKILRIVNES